MSKLYLTNDSGHDISSAYEFVENGKENLIVLTKGKVNIFRTDELLEEITEKMKDFHKDDILIITGNSVINCMIFGVALIKNNKVKFLIHSSKNDEYVVRTLDYDRFKIQGDDNEQS